MSVLEKAGLGGLHFPPEFLWGSATSPTQVEGETCNEWAGFIARDGSHADEGCEGWHDFERDFQLIDDLNLNAFRLGLDWGRLQPGPGQPLNEAVVERYREMLGWLTGRGIVPFVTLFHFACPQWLAQIGGWTNPQCPAFFADFVRRVAELDLPVQHWVTVNEPEVYLTMAYLIGIFPPHKRFSFTLAWKAFRNLSAGHHLARAALKSHNPDAQAGIAKHFKFFMPHRRWHLIDRVNVWLCKHLFTLRMLEAFLDDGKGGGSDFIGVNYYGRMRVKGFGDISPVSGTPASYFHALDSSCDDMWEQDPQWLAKLLPSLTRRYHLPLYITEAGFATADEDLRVRLFAEHIQSVHAALENGADIRGFFYWALTDNFEWAEGYTKKFGLAGVDFASENRDRQLRPVAAVYAAISKHSTRRPPRHAG